MKLVLNENSSLPILLTAYEKKILRHFPTLTSSIARNVLLWWVLRFGVPIHPPFPLSTPTLSKYCDSLHVLKGLVLISQEQATVLVSHIPHCYIQ